MKNWTAPGKDEVHGFCIKHLTSLHPKIAQQLNRLLQTATIEEWQSTGKTILLMKNKKAGAIPSNYRPITCLSTTFKLITVIVADINQNHLYKYNLKNRKETEETLGAQKTSYSSTR